MWRQLNQPKRRFLKVRPLAPPPRMRQPAQNRGGRRGARREKFGTRRGRPKASLSPGRPARRPGRPGARFRPRRVEARAHQPVRDDTELDHCCSSRPGRPSPCVMNRGPVQAEAHRGRGALAFVMKDTELTSPCVMIRNSTTVFRRGRGAPARCRRRMGALARCRRRLRRALTRCWRREGP